MSSFDFEQAFQETRAYQPGEATLGKGVHDVTIDKVEDSGTSRNSLPQFDVFVSNDEGRQKDRLYISPREFAIAKVVGLVEAAGIDRPTKDDLEEDGRLSQAYLRRLEGKRIQIAVRMEEDRKDATKEWPRVYGYNPIVDGPDVPIDTSDCQPSLNTAADDDIPF